MLPSHNAIRDCRILKIRNDGSVSWASLPHHTRTVVTLAPISRSVNNGRASIHPDANVNNKRLTTSPVVLNHAQFQLRSKSARGEKLMKAPTAPKVNKAKYHGHI